ncbi:MAG: prolyl oligopeptidase family serine peptidase [Nitrospira sp.]|nr:prolyl oligopeptidase family serine peptidase [Nitrospira sp.]
MGADEPGLCRRIAHQRNRADQSALLLIHGKKDVTVDHAQSDRMAAAMRRAGKPVEFLSLPLADHYFTREADRLALLEAMGAFLRTHNPPD